MLFKASAATIAGVTLALAGNPDKPEMNPGFDYGRFEGALRDNLHPTHSSWDYWGPGWIPEGCKTIAESHGLNANDFTIFNVHYDDCQEGWTFCRHKDAGASEIDMIDMFGRAPVHMRQFIRHPIATPGLNDGAAAFIYNSGDVVFESAPDLSTVLHEMSHSLDWHGRTDRASPFSSTGDWQNEYNKDSNTVTGYGRTNWMENFAEAGKIGVFDKVVPGGFGSVAGNWGQVFHQYATYQGWYDEFIHPGGSCAKRFGNSETVPKSGAKMAVSSKPDNSFKSSNVTIIEPKGKLEKILQAVEVPLTSLADDAERTRKAVKQIDGPVLLVGHSYGSAVITEASNLPNVVGLVYIAAFAPDKGESAGSISAQYPAVAAVEERLTSDSDGYLWVKTDKFQETFCQDVSKDKALVMAITQKAPLASTFGDNVTDPAWKHKKSWYQISTEDRCINPKAENFMSERIKPVKTIELKAGHASLASLPKEVSDLIAEAAGN